MDVGEHETNTFLVSNISSIAYRIYEPIASLSSTYTFNASDAEDSLRNDGHLVYMDAVRRGIWCFYLTSKDASQSAPEDLGLNATMEVCGYQLGMVEEGSFEPTSLLKSRPSGTNSINTPNSSSSTGSGLESILRVPQPGSTAAGAPTIAATDSEQKTGAGTVLESRGYGSIPTKEVYEFFITAIISSLSTAFCRQVGAIPLNHRNVLLPSGLIDLNASDMDCFRRPPAMATFRIYLTTTGTLVITLLITIVKGLVSSADALQLNSLPAGTLVLAAPFGAFGSFQGIKEGETNAIDTNLGRSPDTQTTRPRLELNVKMTHWKSTCSRLIQMHGVSPSLLEGSSWLSVQFVHRKPLENQVDGKRTPVVAATPVTIWPAVLCFRRLWSGVSPESGHRKPTWSFPMVNYDALGNASSWFHGSADREDLMAKRSKEREAMQTRETTDLDVRGTPIAGYSPLTLYRAASIGGPSALGAMYPTPPDAILPPGPPSYEGNVSSPATQHNQAPIPDTDGIMTRNMQPTEDFNGEWAASDAKREQQSVAFLEGGNLFGDLGEDMFENNELTDADFNFFDERPVSDEMDLSALQDMGSALDMTASMSQMGSGLDAQEAASAMRPASSPFMKPELRHARSTLAEDERQRSATMAAHSTATGGAKRQPDPFSPDTVYKKIRAKYVALNPRDGRPNGSPVARSSVFERVDFDPSLSLVTKKYRESGRFKYSPPRQTGKETERPEDGGILSTTGPRPAPKDQKAPDEARTRFNSIMAKVKGEGEGPVSRDASRRGDVLSDADDLSLASDDEDDSSQDSDEPPSPAKSNIFRRRVDDDVASMAASFKDLENTTGADSPCGGLDLSRLSNTENSEMSMARYFADPDPTPTSLFCSDESLVLIAQILTEQAVGGSLQLGPRTSSCPGLLDMRKNLVTLMHRSLEALRAAVPRSLRGAGQCRFRPYLDVQDVPLLGQPARVQPRPAGQELVRPNIFQIPIPHVELKRYETSLSVLPSALAFWESLGLGPSQGPKDVVPICVFPNLAGLRDNAAAFLDRMRSIYESLKLGVFEGQLDGLSDGLLACDTEVESPGPNGPRPGQSFTESMARLSEVLAMATCAEKNFVAFFVYSSDNPSTILDSCAAFQELYHMYKKVMDHRKKDVVNDLVLQLVPLDSVASETSLAILSPTEYIKLAIQTYDRCTLFGGPMPAPAIVLEKSLPRGVEFRPTANPSPNLLQENSCLHLAYCQSVDERWATAAWTDNRGSRQLTASYCLGRRSKPLSSPLSEALNEMWETTQDLISTVKVNWRVIVTKCGPIDQAEVDFWQARAGAETRVNISLTVITVDTKPSLQLVPPAVKLPTSAHAGLYSTPVSTPQPLSATSPDQSGNPGTPLAAAGGTSGLDTGANEVDNDATLVDVTETTWGAIISHRLSNSSSLTDLNPALVSGYLVKRSGIKTEDPFAVMEVNIIHSDQNPRAGNPRIYEILLREVLMFFRGLGTIARLRGVVDAEVDVRPWHVAAVEKAVHALYQLM